MSKFRTRLRNLSRPEGIGFGALMRRERTRHVLVLAEVTDAATAADAAEAGVDAIVLRGAASALSGLDLGTALAGILLTDATKDDVTAARDAGADFFLFDDGRAQAGALGPLDIGRILLLGPDQETERLRSIAAVDLDAVVVTGDVGSITVRDQIGLRRVAGLVGAPLVIAASGLPDAATLEAWRDAGAPAVLVSGAAGNLRAVVEAAAAVPAPQRRAEGATPSISMIHPPGHDHDHDDDDL